MAVDVRRKHPFLDFDIDFTGWSLTDRCLFESSFNDCVKCSKGDAKILKYLFDKPKTHNKNCFTFNRYESIIIMIWQNVIEKIEINKSSIKNDIFCGYYLTKGGYLYSTCGRKLVGYTESDGKRFYNLPRKTKKVYDIKKHEWIK